MFCAEHPITLTIPSEFKIDKIHFFKEKPFSTYISFFLLMKNKKKTVFGLHIFVFSL